MARGRALTITLVSATTLRKGMYLWDGNNHEVYRIERLAVQIGKVYTFATQRMRFRGNKLVPTGEVSMRVVETAVTQILHP